jgi:hypothetical protein
LMRGSRFCSSRSKLKSGCFCMIWLINAIWDVI